MPQVVVFLRILLCDRSQCNEGLGRGISVRNEGFVNYWSQDNSIGEQLN